MMPQLIWVFRIVLLLPVACVGGSKVELLDNGSFICSERICPANCTCSLDQDGAHLVIDCGKRPELSQFADEVDCYINSSSSRLTNLEIINSPLTTVPNSVCLAANLLKLNLASNKLTLLPENCFSNLLKLSTFSAKNNEISELQDGIFNGLANLLNLDLSSNEISKIGLHTFTVEAGLTRLYTIDLHSNKLTALEPWPFIRGQLVPFSTVNLGQNDVSMFTNEIGWYYRCGVRPLRRMNLDLSHNQISNMMDLFNGWNISDSMSSLFCLFGYSQSSGLVLNFDKNPFNCDCRDYTLYAVVHYYQHIKYMVNLYCSSPWSLENRKIISIPLDEFKCDIPSPPCLEGCQCIKRPSDMTYFVTCQNLTSLPVVLPNTSYPPPRKAKYALQFKESNLNTVDDRSYFKETNSLDISQSSVFKVTDEAWRALMQLSIVDLSMNNLTVLSPVLLTIHSTITSLSLFDNPWRCNCEDRWIRDWLASFGERLKSPKSVLCNSPGHLKGRSILSTSDEEFCIDPDLEQILMIIKIVVPTVMGSVLIALVITSILYHLRVKAFVHLRIHPFDVDECEGEDMVYDVFLSCAYADREIARRILNRLELAVGNDSDTVDDHLLPPGGYRVCYHERDFTPGDLIMENIQRAIIRSRRVVCLLTPHFISSEYCMMEFRAAWNHHTVNKKRRLVVVKWPEVDLSGISNDQTGTDLLLFLSTHTYVNQGTTGWWNQFIYALTIQGLPRIVESPAVLSEATSREHLVADQN